MKKLVRTTIIIIILVSLIGGTQIQSVRAATEWVVTNTSDSGPGSLRQVIADASNGDTITFAPHLAGETIHLASTLEIDKSITIDGLGLNPRITLSGDTDDDGVGDVQILTITTYGNVRILGLDFANGKKGISFTGGIANFGWLEISACTFSGNTGDLGGALLNRGNLTIQDCKFIDNYAYDGGAIFNDIGSTATISDTVFIQNAANTAYGSGGAIGNIGDLLVTRSEFSGNTAAGGGSIINARDGSTTISQTSFKFNFAITESGGAVYNLNGTMTISASFAENTADGDGGAIYNQGTMEVIKSTVANNSADMGGGIANIGTLTITNSNILENSVAPLHGGGGGILNFNDLDKSGVLTITNSTISSNTAPSGGGILNLAPAGEVTILNSTISNNTVSSSGGGVSNFGILTMENSTLFGNSAEDGGGIINFVTLTMVNNTLSGNTAENGGGLLNGGTLHMFNTILANSLNGEDCFNHETEGVISTNINNLVETNAVSPNQCDTPVITSDPNLAPPANNGGPTQTMGLLPGSPAIDAGDNASCPATDQRGVTRPQGSHCDIGAYEKISISTPTFADVPFNGFGWAQIESIYAAGITGGCSTNPLNYCPNQSITRAQMAVFLLRGIHGSSYTPPPATGTVFNDVPSNAFAAAWIEQMVDEGITAGCGGCNFCPNGLVTRAQMAVFLLRAKHGSSYTPPSATGTVFTDVPSNAFAASWIEQLVAEGITSGCGGGNYCPNQAVTRAQMAVFLQRTFNLPMP